MAGTDDLCRSFLDLWFHFDPAAATRAGIAGQDGRLGGFDAESVRLHVAALRSIAAAVEDLDIDDTGAEIDRTALLDHLRVLLFRFEHEHPWRRNPALWVAHACDALDGLLARHPPDAVTAADALSRIRALPTFFISARETLKKPPLLLVEVALAQLDGLAALVDAAASWFGLLWEVESDEGPAAVKDALDGIARIREALGSEIAPDATPHGAAIGEEEVDRRLHYEHASVHNGAEVWRGALRLATEVEQEIVALAAALDASRPWRDVYERLPGRAPMPESALLDFADALRSGRRFAESHGLTGPAGAPLEVMEAKAYERALESTAFYQPAGAQCAAAIVVPGGDHLAVPWLAVQLGIPGIHLHRTHSDALPNLVRRHIAAASTPLGWGLYGAELMWSAGYAPEPESRLAGRVLFLRDAHLAVVDVGVHTRQLTPVAAIAHLTTHLPIDRRSAEVEVRRIACRPLLAAAAILGRNELFRLREDIRAERGAGFDLAAFHADVLRYGGLPVPLIRWGLGLDG